MHLHVNLEGGGPAIVLLHGIPGSGAVWGPVVARLEGDRHLLVPDLLGFGASPRPRSIDELWADRQAAALEATLRSAGVTRAVFAAHDYGGPVALSLFRRRPDLFAGLCLIATNTFADTPIPLPIRAVTWPLVGHLAERVLLSGPSLTMMLKQGSSADLDPKPYLGDHRQQEAVRTIFSAALRELDTRYVEVEGALGRIDCPTTVVWGERDPFFPLAQGARTADAIPGAELVVYEGCGHFVPGERPDQLATALVTLAARAGAAGVAA